ncbi:GNAT family N-acetyltransferase [bacterium]|nr:MAG: GNAT family N-acetyltransferase [bacterium]
MPTIHHLRYDDPDYAAKSVSQLNLVFQVWPPKDGDEVDVPTIIEKARERKCHHFTIVKDEETLAIATLFVREIFTARGSLPVGALAGVCVHPNYRGHGWGRDVVLAAFDFLPRLEVEVSLFQTGVPDFYARLGARLVFNRFHNGSNPRDPFHDAHKMIFPTSFDWPDGDIDLGGPGY